MLDPEATVSLYNIFVRKLDFSFYASWETSAVSITVPTDWVTKTM